MTGLVAAVDVGTGSARAGIFDGTGRLLGRGEHPIVLHRPAPDRAEYASEAIWAAVGHAVRAARRAAAAREEAIAGLAFDATCSLVVRDAAGAPVAVGADGDDSSDTIAWLDHRAMAEAAALTATGHPAIAREGGAMSPEMQLPKLMWLAARLPASWARAGLVFDLADFLAWRASGATARSLCTLGCKWTYRADLAAPWQTDLLAAAGLPDLPAKAGITAAVAVGTRVGRLTPAAAAELGLAAGTAVAAGLIDAHAGALGVLGDAPLPGHLALIAGTSTCLMACLPAAQPAPGIWGPHLGAILPDRWLIEAGQSASGGLLDHVCRVWGGAEPDAATHARVCARIGELRAAEGWDLARRLQVLPDFHGNRSPFADPAALGVVSGLGLDASFDALCRLYWRTAVALAHGLRQIAEELARPVGPIRRLHAAGGHVRSGLLMELYAASLGAPIDLPGSAEPVLLGTAMAAAAGAGLHPGLAAAAAAMRPPDAGTVAAAPQDRAALDRDHAIFRELQRQRRRLDELLAMPALGIVAASRGT